jgi:uncharacterized spore protein YtfJ
MDVQETLKAISERLQSAASVKCVYGDPVTAGDRTVIPVARVKFGFGSGGSNNLVKGGGGGGGMQAEPVGVLEITSAGSAFKDFPDYRRIGIVFAAGILLGMCLSRRRR